MPSSLRKIFQSREKQKESVKERPASAAATSSHLSVDTLNEDNQLLQDTTTVATAVKGKKPSLNEQLWDDAYEELRKENPKLISAYEVVLSKHLREAKDLREDGDDQESNANIISTDIGTRKEQLQQIISKGLLKAGDGATKKAVATSIEKVNAIKNIVAAGLQPSREATLVWTALTAILPFALNATSQSEKNREGVDLTLVILKKTDILSRTLVDPDAERLRCELTCKLYKTLLSFLIKSACYYNKNRLVALLADSINDWEAQVKDIRDAENNLKRLLKELTPLNKEDSDCLAKFFITNPRHDKIRIEQRAGALLQDCYRWILDHTIYQHWQQNHDLLWISGDPGKGKTMLLCGIINELASNKLVAFFFCEAKYQKTHDNSTAVLRGLIWMLANQDRRLIQHIKRQTDSTSDNIYHDINSFIALSEIFDAMLPDLKDAVLIVDALDECIEGREQLLDLIKRTTTSHQIQWLVSSRSWPVIEARLIGVSRLALEHEISIEGAVKSYIDFKVRKLSNEKAYTLETQQFILKYLNDNATETFLWVSLVCANLNEVGKRLAKKVVIEYPSTLDGVYNRMHQQVQSNRDSDILNKVLSAASLVYRPVTIEELKNILELSEEDEESLKEIVQDCGSFLTIRHSLVEFVHQSAQEYIRRNGLAAESIHKEIYMSSMKTMFDVLKRNIYCLTDPAVATGDISQPSPDPLLAIKYCCIHWTQHLQDMDPVEADFSEHSDIAAFFHHFYLCWLEATALLREGPQAIYMINIVRNITQRFNSSLADLVDDAYRFVLYFREMVAEYPLQIYDSGLTFCPANSLVRKAFVEEYPNWVQMTIHPEPDWPIYLTGFSLGTGGAWARGFTGSADGKWIAILWSGYVEVWDAVRGTLTRVYHCQHASMERAALDFSGKLAFSSDSSKVYTVCVQHPDTDRRDLTILSWDLHTNECQQGLRFHARLWDLSPNASYLATINTEKDGNKLRIYDVRRETSVTCVIDGNTDNDGNLNNDVKDEITAFAQDSSALAVWQKAGSLSVWLTNGMARIFTTQCKNFNSHQGLAVSSQGRLLAIGGADPSILEIYDTQSGAILWTESYAGEQFVFLQEASCIATINTSGILEIMHETTGECLHRDYQQHIKCITTCGQSIVMLHENWKLRSFSIRMYAPRGSTRQYSRIQHTEYHMTDRYLSIAVYDEDPVTSYPVYHLQKRSVEDGKLLSSSPSSDKPPWLRTLQRYFLIDVAENSLTIYRIRETSIEKHFTWELPGGRSFPTTLSCSPDGLHLAVMKQEQVMMIDIEQRSMTTDHIPYPHRYSCIPSTDFETAWLDQGKLFLRKANSGSILWSAQKGFTNVELSLKVAWTSIWGSWVACKTNEQTLYHEKREDIPWELQRYDQVEIWDMATIKLMSVVNIDGGADQVFVLPDCNKVLAIGSNIFSRGRRASVWTLSGVLETMVALEEYFYMVYPLTDTLLQTERGVLSIENGIQFGSEQYTYRDRDWFYRDGVKILWIPPFYRDKPYRVSETRNVGHHANDISWFRHASNRIAVLKFSFDKA